MKTFFLILTSIVSWATWEGAGLHQHQTKALFYKTIGGKGIETNQGLFKTSDGSYILTGRTDSYSIGDMNMNVIKVDEQGNVVWDKNFGSDESEEAYSGIETSDGMLMVVGYSDSYGGGVGLKDFWVIRLDQSGLLKWQNTYGTRTSIDEARDIIETEDGHFLVVGTTLSLESAKSDILLVKIDKEGREVWRKTYGKEKNDMGNSIIRTNEGFLIVGQTESMGYGRWEAWAVALDKEGEQLWERAYGGPDNEMGNAGALAADGNIIITGYTYSFAEGSHDAWIFEIDAKGRKIWDKSLGGMSTDEFFDVIVTEDNHVVAAGYTDIYVPDEFYQNTSPLGHNVFVAKLDRKGNVRWQKNIGGNHMQVAHGLEESHQKNGYLLSGYTNEALDTRGMDMFVLKVDKNGQ